MSSPLPQTAAEKAEARRLKILAKKRARMAYASGDRSLLPSASAPEPVPVVTSTTPPIATIPSSTTGPLLSSLLAGNPLAPSALSRLHVPAWLRSASVALCAVSYVACTRSGLLAAWRVSAVELFAYVELCLALPRAVAGVGGGDGGAGAGLGWVDAAVRVGRYAAAAREVGREFAVFMLCFLCAWYVGERV